MLTMIRHLLQQLWHSRPGLRASTPGLVLGALVLLLVALTRPQGLPQVAAGSQYGTGVSATQAEVVRIVEEGTIAIGPDQEHPYQVVLVRLLDGEWAGQEVEIDYGKQQLLPSDVKLSPGTRILVAIGQRPDGNRTAYFLDFDRSIPLAVLGAAFVLFSVLVSGWKGLRGLLGMGVSLVIILQYILPRILHGDDPVLVSVTGSFVLLAVTLYITYGWTLKTHVAVLGTFCSLVVTGLLAGLFVSLTRLTGYGTEEATYLVVLAGTQVNVRGLVLGGLIIGALGVLDDLTTTQSAAVFELYMANPDVSLRSLYARAMRIGQDHVAATVNTLVLAYAGASLPLLLLFSLSGQPAGQLVNMEFVTQELVRTLVGSLGLMTAVPITTGLACLTVVYHDHLHRLRPFLGPGMLDGDYRLR